MSSFNEAELQTVEISNNWRNVLSDRSLKTISPALKEAEAYSTKLNQHNVYVYEMLSLLKTLRVLGVLPYQITASGQIHSAPLLSAVTLYTILARSTIMALTTLFFVERIPIVGKSEVPFLVHVVDIGYMMIFFTSFLLPVTLWLEQKTLISYFAHWEYFQARYTRTTGKQLKLRLRKKSLISLVIILITTATVTTNTSFLGENSLPSVWESVAFAYSVLLCFLQPFIWYLSCDALSTAAKILASYLDTCHQQYQRLAELRHLWKLLSRLTRELGFAVGLTYGAICLIFLSTATLGVYAGMYSVQAHKAVQAAIFLITTLIFVGLLYLQCDSAERTTDQVGKNFQRQLENFAQAQSSSYSALEDEISLFLQSIQISPPMISYCGFTDVNRYLMSSFISAMVTYIIVLLQFETSSE